MTTENKTIGDIWEEVDAEMISNPTNTQYSFAVNPTKPDESVAGHPFLPFSGYTKDNFTDTSIFWVRTPSVGTISITKA